MNISFTNSAAIKFILVVSAGILIFLFWLIYFHEPLKLENPIDVSILPSLNALLNFLSATCLSLGFISIKKGNRNLHKKMMFSALTFSALFLVSYLIYHTIQGDTPYKGEGWERYIYFFILVSHVLLSIIVLPLILTTVFFASRRNFSSHSKIARITLPVWLYVSITGVIVYLMLYIV